MTDSLTIAGTRVEPGTRISVQIPVARRYTHNDVYLPTHVVNGREPGPNLFLSAAVHGDEINGTEIIRRLLKLPELDALRGALVAIPIVNVYGFVAQSRYLPDRRDLNRSFPGSPSGSLAARVAHIFMQEVVSQCSHGIDVHTGALHRTNLPQIRACLGDAETLRLARAFGAPVIMDATLRDGSMRQAVLDRGIPMLVYEAGEALRFDEVAIRAGIQGVLSVMRALDMLPEAPTPRRTSDPFVARGSSWVRAPASGILHSPIPLGARVDEGQVLGEISDPLGDAVVEVHSHATGVVIGRTNLPLVNEGDALLHVAVFKQVESVMREVEAFHADLDTDAPNPGEPEPN
jgi:predicted deacylase